MWTTKSLPAGSSRSKGRDRHIYKELWGLGPLKWDMEGESGGDHLSVAPNGNPIKLAWAEIRGERGLIRMTTRVRVLSSLGKTCRQEAQDPATSSCLSVCSCPLAVTWALLSASHPWSHSWFLFFYTSSQYVGKFWWLYLQNLTLLTDPATISLWSKPLWPPAWNPAVPS